MARRPKLSKRYAELIEALDQAEIIFQQDVQNAGRKGAGMAVAAVVKFLGAVGEDEAVAVGVRSFERARPLLTLLAALADLDEGISTAMLRRAMAGNAPTTAMLDRFSRAQAASAMECLMRCGLSRRDAAREVAKAIEGRSYAQGYGRDLWKVVARWRDDLRAPGADPNHHGVSSYRQTLELLQGMAKAPNGRERLRKFAVRLMEEKVTAGHPV